MNAARQINPLGLTYFNNFKKNCMKNIAMLLLLVTAFIVSCVKETGKKDIDQRPASTPKFVDIAEESGLRSYSINTAGKTWKDLDAFYQQSVNKYKDHEYLFNFQSEAIFYMTQNFKILDDNSSEATNRISFYAQEMSKLRNCNPTVLYPMLVRLQNHWEPSKIVETASIGSKNAASLFKAMDTSTPNYAGWKNDIENLQRLSGVQK
ncbi:MAG: hypothetical protein ACKVU2_18065 [Saprospiraceae bacterium]